MRNYLLVHDELGLDPGPAIAHLEQEFGAEFVRPLVERVEQELRGPFHFFDAIYCINLDRETGRWESVMRQCKALGIDHRIRRFAAIDTPTSSGIGRALSHRAVVAEAKWQGLDNVLVLEDDVVFARRRILAQAAELRGVGWPGASWGTGTSGVGATGFSRPPGAMSLHAVAYHHTVYDQILTRSRPRPPAWRAGSRLTSGSATTTRSMAVWPLDRGSPGRSRRSSRWRPSSGDRGFRVSFFGVHLDVAAIRPPRWRCWTAISCRGCHASRSGGRRPMGSWRCGVPATAMGSRCWSTSAVAGAAPGPLTAIPSVQRALDESGSGASGRRRGARRRRRPRGPRHPVARPDPRGQVNARRGAGTARRTLLLRRVRAHRRRGPRTPVPPALLLRDGSGYDQPRLATELGGTVAHEPLSAGLIVGLRYPAAAPFSAGREPGRGRVAALAQHASGARRPAVDPDAAGARRRGCGLLCRTAGEAREAAAAILQLASSRGERSALSGACRSTSAGAIPVRGACRRNPTRARRRALIVALARPSRDAPRESARVVVPPPAIRAPTHHGGNRGTRATGAARRASN